MSGGVDATKTMFQSATHCDRVLHKVHGAYFVWCSAGSTLAEKKIEACSSAVDSSEDCWCVE